MKYKFKIDKPQGYPQAPWRNAVLRTQQEVANAVKQVEALGLPLHGALSKNWDTLAALDCILQNTDAEARILDAGAETYSTILPCLYFYGYKHLKGINLVFERPFRRGPIVYEYGDITHTKFEEGTFDVVTCLSVIEHGVNLRSYFQEVSRILKPNGILITSTDYYAELVETHNQVEFGVPIHVFSKDEVISALNIAKECGLELTDDIDLGCQEKPVRWDQFGLNFTFLVFTLRKVVTSSS